MARLTGGVDEEPPALSIQAAEASIAAAVQSSDSGYGYRQSVLADSGRDSASIASDSRVSASVWSIAHFVTHHVRMTDTAHICRPVKGSRSRVNVCVHQTQLFIYGGYLRDFFIRGDVHGEMHLDVGFDSQHGKPPRPQLSPPLPNMAEARREWGTYQLPLRPRCCHCVVSFLSDRPRCRVGERVRCVQAGVP